MRIQAMALSDTDKNILVDNVKKDIDLYGSGFRVYVIYKKEIITHYVESDKPIKDEGEDEETYSLKLQQYKERIKSIQGTQKKFMTLGELQDVLNRN